MLIRKDTTRIRGFTMTGLIVSVAIVALIAGSAAFYYQGTLEQERAMRAKIGLERLARAWSRWTMRHGGSEPPDLMTLVADGREDWLYDPWGNPYGIDWDTRQLYSLGPEEHDGGRAAELYPLTMDLPPLVKHEREPRSLPRLEDLDQEPPSITQIQPSCPTYDLRPVFTIRYADDYAGVDRDSIRMWHGRREVTHEASIGATNLRWIPNQDFAPGTHRFRLYLTDFVGRETDYEWSLIVKERMPDN